jgi:antitoxin FitA
MLDSCSQIELALCTILTFDINAIIDYNEIIKINERSVASLTIRNLDPTIKERLRVRAAKHGHSMEAEARHILQSTLQATPAREINLAETIRRRFAPLGGVDDLELHTPVPVGPPPQFEP